ncbi:MAG: helix-turn-helix domain-containing protein [Muricauda sp. TMED12]|nr:MAG: helix-turn-helix domain-containing protein [Muricauda sp. TMED12]
MDEYSFWMGILFLLLLQAFILGIFLLLDRKNTNVFLGAFVMIYIHNAIKNSFPYYLYEDYIITKILVTSTSSIFYFPVLYLFVLAHIKKIPRPKILKHLVIPTIFFLSTLIFNSHTGFLHEGWNYYFSLVMNLLLMVCLIYYGFLTVRVIMVYPEWKDLLLQIRRRVAWFSIFIFSYFFLVMAWILIQYFIDFTDQQNEIISKIQQPLFYFVILLVPVYSYITLNRFKKFIQPQKIILNKAVDIDLEQQTHELFTKEKRHLDPAFNVGKLADLLEMPIEDLRILINNQYHCSVMDFINKMRIEEFKILVEKDGCELYNIEGLAKNCGFNSRATFYRAFKKHEGKTPSAYIKNIGD